jgi:hypothetical protein
MCVWYHLARLKPNWEFAIKCKLVGPKPGAIFDIGD